MYNMKKIKLRLNQLITIIKYFFIKLIYNRIIDTSKYQNIWLICERGDEAKDNGFIFFEYLCNKHPEIDARYVISKNSPDIKNIQHKNKIVYYQSIQHIQMFIQAKYLISTHIMGFSPEFRSFSKLSKKFSFFEGNGKKIFLQHGIIYNFLPSLKNLNLDLFITSSEKEKKFIIETCNYNDSIVKCTGLARYDKLIGKTKNFILLMPTWRSNLFYANEEEFKTTEYFHKWNEILHNKKLHQLLEENQIKLYFYPHYEIQRFIKCFHTDNKNIVFANSDEYQISTLLRECKMMITDYTSASFDVSYMKKPLIFYQFDYNDFYTKHYKEGYMTMKNDGFGLVTNDINELLNELKKIIKNKFNIESKYEKRINNFYKYNDQKNCERIYKNILELERKR